MTYWPKTQVVWDTESTSTDAFSRGRVSQPETIFDVKQLGDDRSLYFDTQFLLNASSSYNYYKSSTTLSVSNTSGSKAIRQSRIHSAYQPGKSQYILNSFVFGTPQTGIRKRVGLFDDNNGIFLENTDGVTNIVLRSNVTGVVVDTVVSQSAWNEDKMDGTGVSGHILDISKVQFFIVDIKWMGRIRCAFDVGNEPDIVHEFYNTNVSGTAQFRSPNLPVRYEITNMTGATSGSMEHMTCAMISEGGYDPTNIIGSVDRAITPVSGVSNAGLVPVISMRIMPGRSGSHVVPNTANIYCTTTANSGFRWALLYNPTIAGTDFANWQNVPSSSIQYDVGRNSTNTVTNGFKIAGGYGSSATDLIQSNELASLFPLGMRLDGRPDELVLCVQVVGATTESFVGSLGWKWAG